MRKPKPIRPQLVTDRTGTTYTLAPLPVITQPSLFDAPTPAPPATPASAGLFGEGE
jgi:hypothetical protein